MKRAIVVRPAADRDIDEQFVYLALEAGEQLALRFLESTQTCFERLLEMPELGAIRTFENPELEGLRMFPVAHFEAHLVFYRPTSRGIEVVRVLHGARDLKRLLESRD
jgi:toxin ParE1/3/4